ncbi:LTA synthase family protein [Desulfosporosinus sp. SB140]|uniref:LTA synthase family protein n=1 Tax=Desulfosporosinus paludis TaxID=3115649 RepID=UPI00388F5007
MLIEVKRYLLTKCRQKSPNLLYITIIPLVCLLALEIFSYGNFFNVYTWIRQYPKQFFLNYILMFGIINVFYIFPRSVYLMISSIQVGLFSILGSISREKFIAKGSPLIPSDFSLAKEAIEISARFKDVYIWLSLIALGIVVLIVLILKFTPHENYKWRQKTAVFLIAAAMVTFFYTKFGSIEETFSLELINLSQRMNYDENGMMLGFFLNAEYLKVQVPSEYQESTIQQIVDTTKKTYSTDPNFKPNIIFVMSEAFWDPTLLKNVSFNKDPIPFFHSLQKSQTSGTMLSPVYGGGTANTEFEALTGFSTQFLPSGSIPYAQYVNKPVEALPTILQRQGYATSAIHTYDNWFYNRNNVYKELGFDKFVSKEFFNNPEYKGQYIRDTELSQKVLDEVKETKQPDFIYAVSMQNHGPYSDVESPQNTVYCTDSNLSVASKAMLDNYSNSVADVDQSIKQLIDGLKQIDQPTVVIFYGDHLPMLGDDYSVYKEAGFIKGDNSYQDYLNLHSVPFVTWNNFSTTKQNLRLSANYMGTYALQLAQKSGSPMTDFLSNLMQSGSDVVTNPEYSTQEKLTPTEANQYQQLQYDLLFGKEYTYQIEANQKPPTNSGYIQGDGTVTIANAVVSNGVLEIYGENFVENDKVYIDGKLTNSTFDDSNKVSVSLPGSSSSNTRSLKIQIKLSDSMNKVISQSNVYQLPRD